MGERDRQRVCRGCYCSTIRDVPLIQTYKGHFSMEISLRVSGNEVPVPMETSPLEWESFMSGRDTEKKSFQ